MENNPYQEARDLETKIHNGAIHLPGVINSLSSDAAIRTYFGDKTLNGVDNYIQFRNYHILTQDKWCEKGSGQQEISQFLMCTEKINNILTGSKPFLIWVCKTIPTRNSILDLNRKNVKIIASDTSVNELVQCVIEHVKEIIAVQSSAMEIED